MGLAAIALGGISTALWGGVFSARYLSKKPKQLFKDFFGFRQKVGSYLFALILVALDLCYVLFGGRFEFGSWYTPIVLFLTHIILGGIEEIGWRNFFQPVLQERMPYVPAVLLTFVCWGIWHFSYFYVDGSFNAADVLPFLTGLLVNCFILSAVYIRTESLWLCVMTHSLINTLSQTAKGGDVYIYYPCIAVIIAVSVWVAYDKKNVSEKQ